MSTIVLPFTFPFDDPALPYQVMLMRLSDIDQIMPLEQASFRDPWPATAYHYDLTQNDLATYLILKLRKRPLIGRRQNRQHLPPVLAYGGLWLMVDEAHVSTIATHPDWRGRGLGEMMLVALVDVACLRQAAEVTLEVRVLNVVAQNLYRKYGFAVVGERKGYYRDGEDALIMTTPHLDDADFRQSYATLKAALRQRLARERVLNE